MENIIVLIILVLLCCIIWALPLYVVVNFACWVFHLSFHLTLIQSFAICLVLSVIRNLLFGKEDK